jgi:malate synthase
VEAYLAEPVKPPWYVDLLNLNLGLGAGNDDLEVARQRIARYLVEFRRDGRRITENLDFTTIRTKRTGNS